MTEQEKQLLKKYPIHWREEDCEEMCLQSEALLTDEYKNNATQEMIETKERLYDELKNGSNGGYLYWSYMKTPMIEELIEEGIWKKNAALGFFTANNAPI